MRASWDQIAESLGEEAASVRSEALPFPVRELIRSEGMRDQQAHPYPPTLAGPAFAESTRIPRVQCLGH